MDVWIIFIPILKVLLYVASFGSVGNFLFSLHFSKQLTEKQQVYCDYLAHRGALIGAVTSLVMILSVAGNLGGDLESVIDLLFLQLAIQSKAGVGYSTAFAGFAVMLIAHNLKANTRCVGLMIGSVAVWFSFTISGHSQVGGVLTQSLLMVHLLGIAFWLGALLPFRGICLQPDISNLGGLAHRFGVLAMRYVGLLLSAGLGYAYLLLGDITLIFTTLYGNVLLTKIVLVGVLLSLAALNKFKLVPSLEIKPSQAVRRFQSSVQFEIALALVILTASSLLTTSLTLPMGVSSN
jgi:putative copper resistance protein D